MKKQLIYIIGIVASLFTACENISEDERFLEVEGVTAQRVVLLEDYTGQACVNCPSAHDVATELHEEYPENLIVVAMHAGVQAISPSVREGGLKQEEGDEYAKNAGVEALPIGQINRRSGLLAYTAWTATLLEELNTPSVLDIAVKANEKDGQLHVETAMLAMENIEGKLQLWVLEDSIISFQMLPSKQMDMEYCHNHVFRDAINGTWGENIALELGEQKTVIHGDFELSPTWNPEHLSVVAFVYNDSGVLQAAQCKVTVNE